MSLCKQHIKTEKKNKPMGSKNPVVCTAVSWDATEVEWPKAIPQLLLTVLSEYFGSVRSSSFHYLPLDQFWAKTV